MSAVDSFNNYAAQASSLTGGVSGSGGSLGSNIGTGASVGATAGSFVPVIGTAIGGAIGAVVGVAMTYSDEIGDFFGNKPDKSSRNDGKTKWLDLVLYADPTGQSGKVGSKFGELPKLEDTNPAWLDTYKNQIASWGSWLTFENKLKYIYVVLSENPRFLQGKQLSSDSTWKQIETRYNELLKIYTDSQNAVVITPTGNNNYTGNNVVPKNNYSTNTTNSQNATDSKNNTLMYIIGGVVLLFMIFKK